MAEISTRWDCLTGEVGDEIVLEAAARAIKVYGFCPNRVWAVASSHPHSERILPKLFPPDDTKLEAIWSTKRTGKNSPDVHRGCTFDFCEQSQMNFTSVSQRHESPSCIIKPCSRIEGRFSPETVNEAAIRGESTAWQLYGLRTIQPRQEYMAVSHVWSDGTGTGKWPAGEVNVCLFHFFASIARCYNCDGIWWDTLCIPTDRTARAKAIGTMETNFRNAKFTLVHDSFLRQVTYKDPETACLAILMSPWFSRGWTAVELANSESVLVVFSKAQSEYVLVDLDEILGSCKSARHEAAIQIINGLRRRQMTDLNQLLNVLKSRHTSWARDIPTISALLVGVGKAQNANAKVLGDHISQEEIHRNVLGKIGSMRYGHMFHNSPTVFNGEGWCPARLSTLPVCFTNASLNIDKSGNAVGVWRVAPMATVPKDFMVLGTPHPLARVRICTALNKPDDHRLLIEPSDVTPTRGLIVKVVDTTTEFVLCQFIGTVVLEAGNRCQTKSLPESNIVISYGPADLEEQLLKSQTGDFEQPFVAPQSTKAVQYKSSPEDLGGRDTASKKLDLDNECTPPERHEALDAPTSVFRLERPMPNHARLEKTSRLYHLNSQDSTRVVVRDDGGSIISSLLPDWTLIDLAKAGDNESIKKFIQGRSSQCLECFDSNGRTPVSWAAGEGHWHTLWLMLQRWNCFKLSEIEIQEYKYKADSVSAIDYGREKFAEIFDRADKYGRSPLAWASAEGRTDVLMGLLRYPEIEIDSVDEAGWSPLWYAANYGQLKCMEYLLNAGANQYLEDIDGFTLLQRVAAAGTRDTLKMLLSHTPKFEDKRNAVDDAARSGRSDMIELLIKSEQSAFDLPTWVLEHAIAKGDVKMLKLLLGQVVVSEQCHPRYLKQATYDLTLDAAGKSISDELYPESKGLFSGYATIMKFLFDDLPANTDYNYVFWHGKDWSADGQYGSIHVAAIAGDTQLIDILLRIGRNVWDSSNGRQLTPLYLASKVGNASVVKQLLDASDRAPRKECKAAEDVAERHGYLDIANSIRAHRKQKQYRGFRPFLG